MEKTNLMIDSIDVTNSYHTKQSSDSTIHLMLKSQDTHF